MIYLLRLLVAAAIALGLAACGGGAPGGATQPTGIPTQGGAGPPTAGAPPPTAESRRTEGPPEPTAAPQPTVQPTVTQPAQPTGEPRPADESQSAIVVYHKSGGIMGLDETLTVRADGTLALQSRGGNTKTAQVRPDQLDKLRELIASPQFAQLQAEYRAIGADLFTYEITVPGGTPGHVVTMDGVENPPVLEQLIQELNRLRQAV